MAATPDRLREPSTAHRWRAGTAGLLAGAVTLGVAGLSVRALLDLVSALGARPSVQVGDGVTVLALAVLALALLWCTVLLLTCAVTLLRPRRRTTYVEVELPWHLAPQVALRVTAVLLAVTALGSGPARATEVPSPVVATAQAAAPVPAFGTPALTESAPVPSFGATTAPAADACAPDAAPVPGWTPHRPAAVRARGAEHVRLLSGCGAEDDHAAQIVVRRGDDLWSIVERHLGDQATPARVAAEWPRWYETNKDEIGDDPNVLAVGQTLRIPEGALR
ncbi:LysM peptidoglycan-binding domain-containing protein [Luteipulveratus flavus]|uniref:LysM domain-containing protein n=1 Tax=Luteipulveratus flavus TaxID=3031728 RepID=A0ABT6C4A6_9MICO|nr:hypothetical protein [Luteipulveratus sp. YIM 133296]MDF8262899.1 hypothetical protein [Luteipulveratus sp. YIM 133296]